MSSEIHRELGTADTNFFWKWDNEPKQHMTFKVQLDHQVNGENLLAALEETADIWFILRDKLIEDADGRIVFVQSDQPMKVHCDPVIVSPGAGLNEDRVLAVTYYDQTVSFTGMHSFFDGGSLLMLMKNILCRYFKKQFTETMDVGVLPGHDDGANPENIMFYAEIQRIAEMPFERISPVPYSEQVFTEPDMKYGSNGELSLVEVQVPKDEFLKYCKENGANPSIMLFLLFARAAYRLNPETDLPVTVNNTMNLRPVLGLESAIMGESMGTYLEVGKKQLLETPLKELATMLRADFNHQRSKDYILSRIDDMRRGVHSPQYQDTISLAYMGTIDYGDATTHIKHISAYNDSPRNLDMLELNGVFHIYIQFGIAGRKYAETFTKMLMEENVHAEITQIVDALPFEVRS